MDRHENCYKADEEMVAIRSVLYEIYMQATRKDRASIDKPYLITDLEIIAAKAKKYIDGIGQRSEDASIPHPIDSPRKQQEQVLALIDDARRSENRIQSVIAARELALDEAESDLAYISRHRKDLERELATIREGVTEAAREELVKPDELAITAAIVHMEQGVERTGEIPSKESTQEAVKPLLGGLPSNEQVRAAAHLGVRGDE